jgi:hypothetical protein
VPRANPRRPARSLRVPGRARASSHEEVAQTKEEFSSRKLPFDNGIIPDQRMNLSRNTEAERLENPICRLRGLKRYGIKTCEVKAILRRSATPRPGWESRRRHERGVIGREEKAWNPI